MDGLGIAAIGSMATGRGASENLLKRPNQNCGAGQNPVNGKRREASVANPVH